MLQVAIGQNWLKPQNSSKNHSSVREYNNNFNRVLTVSTQSVDRDLRITANTPLQFLPGQKFKDRLRHDLKKTFLNRFNL